MVSTPEKTRCLCFPLGLVLVLLAFSWEGCKDADRVAEPVSRSAPRARWAVSENRPQEAPSLADASAPALPQRPAPTGKTPKPMLLAFTRDHCLPCDIMHPWIVELKKKYADQLDIAEINIDRKENATLAAYFKAKSIPTQVYVDREGREVSRHTGLATKQKMLATLQKKGLLRKRESRAP
jgi:thioredoxin 1